MCGCKIVIKIHQDNLFHFLSIREPAVRNKSCDLIGDGSERYSPLRYVMSHHEHPLFRRNQFS